MPHTLIVYTHRWTKAPRRNKALGEGTGRGHTSRTLLKRPRQNFLFYKKKKKKERRKAMKKKKCQTNKRMVLSSGWFKRFCFPLSNSNPLQWLSPPRTVWNWTDQGVNTSDSSDWQIPLCGLTKCFQEGKNGKKCLSGCFYLLLFFKRPSTHLYIRDTAQHSSAVGTDSLAFSAHHRFFGIDCIHRQTWLLICFK